MILKCIQMRPAITYSCSEREVHTDFLQHRRFLSAYSCTHSDVFSENYSLYMFCSPSLLATCYCSHSKGSHSTIPLQPKMLMSWPRAPRHVAKIWGTKYSVIDVSCIYIFFQDACPTLEDEYISTAYMHIYRSSSQKVPLKLVSIKQK